MGSTLGHFMLAALALLPVPAAAFAAGEPIAGLNIVTRRQPNGIATVAAISDARGRFTLRMTEPGLYTISTECGNRRGVRACPPRTLSVHGAGVTLRAGPHGTYYVTVRRGRPVVVSGLIVEDANVDLAAEN